jgi:hypothetical protein
MEPASSTWPHNESDPQRQALLTAADRLLAGTPRHSTGNLSVVQLAIEAQVKYWVAAQKHPDLRDHFRKLAAETNRNLLTAGNSNTTETLDEKYESLKLHCRKLEKLLTLYATAINELATENQALREEATQQSATVTPFAPRRPINRES